MLTWTNGYNWFNSSDSSQWISYIQKRIWDRLFLHSVFSSTQPNDGRREGADGHKMTKLLSINKWDLNLCMELWQRAGTGTVLWDATRGRKNTLQKLYCMGQYFSKAYCYVMMSVMWLCKTDSRIATGGGVGIMSEPNSQNDMVCISAVRWNGLFC